MMLTILIFCLCISSASASSEVTLSEEQKKWLKSHPMITVCPDPNYAPIESSINGIPQGLTEDYLALIEEKLNVSFTLHVEDSWQKCYENTLIKQNDVLSTFQITSSRKLQVGYTHPYLFLNTSIITRKKDFEQKNAVVEDFYGKKIAVVEGSFWSEFLTNDHPQIQLVKVASVEQGIKEVSYDKVDAMFVSKTVAEHHIEINKISNVQISGTTPYQIEYRIAVRKDWEEFVGILNLALDSITPEEHRDIRRKWIRVDYYVPWFKQKTITSVIFIFTTTMLLGTAWLVTLRNQVKKKTRELRNINAELEKKVALRTNELERINQKLQALSNLDKTTQIPNRRFLDIELKRLLETQQLDEPITAFMIDVDYFKRYNDTYGHIQGDEALLQVAQTLKSLLVHEEQGIVARFGGEEFTIICLAMSEHKAVGFAERVIETIAKLKIEHPASEIADYLTISVGVACTQNQTAITANELLHNADQALYLAKKNGRNCFALFKE